MYQNLIKMKFLGRNTGTIIPVTHIRARKIVRSQSSSTQAKQSNNFFCIRMDYRQEPKISHSIKDVFHGVECRATQ